MSRTNIDLDDELVARVMQRYQLGTKREAVNLALRRLAGPALTADTIRRVRGIGWDGDLGSMRRSKVDDAP